MIDYSIGFSVPEIEDILSVQKAELKKTLTAYASDGSSVSKRRVDEIHAIIEACQQALQKLAPEKYGHNRSVIQSGFSGYLAK